MAVEFELVVPCFNEARSLPELVRRAASAARARNLEGRFRLVLVDNGSTDGSAGVLLGLAAGEDADFFRVVKLDPNRGYGGGILAGLESTESPWVGYCHADGQCDPEDALRAWDLARAQDTAVLVKGNRHGRLWRDRVVSEVFAWVARLLLGVPGREINAPPKVFPRSLVPELKNAPTGFAWDLFVVFQAARLGWSLLHVDVAWPPRRHGPSNWAHSLRGRLRTIAGVLREAWKMRAFTAARRL